MTAAISNLALVRTPSNRPTQGSSWRKLQIKVRTSWGKIINLELAVKQLQDKRWHIVATVGDLTIDQKVKNPLLEKLSAYCFAVDWTPTSTLTLEQPINLAS